MWEHHTLRICMVLTPVLLMVCGYSFWSIGVFYVLMPPRRVFTQLRAENAPLTTSHREISQYLDSAAAATITKAISSHAHIFSDSSGEFELNTWHTSTSIALKLLFTESHIQRKYHRLVPDPLWPDIHVPTTLVMPFNPIDVAPTFASEECSYLALSNMGSKK